MVLATAFQEQFLSVLTIEKFEYWNHCLLNKGSGTWQEAKLFTFMEFLLQQKQSDNEVNSIVNQKAIRALQNKANNNKNEWRDIVLNRVDRMVSLSCQLSKDLKKAREQALWNPRITVLPGIWAKNLIKWQTFEYLNFLL